MKNWEMYFTDVITLAAHTIFIDKKTKRAGICSDEDCKNCLFNNYCSPITREHWLLDEYKPSDTELTNREKEILNIALADHLNYIAREPSGMLSFHQDMPYFFNDEWRSYCVKYCNSPSVNDMFKQVTSDTPKAIKGLLK